MWRAQSKVSSRLLRGLAQTPSSHKLPNGCQAGDSSRRPSPRETSRDPYRSAAFNRFVVFCNCRFNTSTCLAISSNSSLATNPALAT